MQKSTALIQKNLDSQEIPGGAKPFYGRYNYTYVMMDLISQDQKVTFYSTDLMV